MSYKCHKIIIVISMVGKGNREWVGNNTPSATIFIYFGQWLVMYF